MFFCDENGPHSLNRRSQALGKQLLPFIQVSPRRPFLYSMIQPDNMEHQASLPDSDCNPFTISQAIYCRS